MTAHEHRPSGTRRTWLRPLDYLGFLLSVLYAAPALLYPHGNDQALHGYIGRGLLLGELPFESGISGKPIGIFVVHAVAGLLFGDHQWSIRAFEVITLVAMAPLLALVVHGEPPSMAGLRRMRDGELGCAALVLFGVHYTFFDYWDISHPETWLGLCTLAATCVACSELRATRRVVTVGALCGAAFMLKYTAAVIALPIAALCGLRALLCARRGGSSPVLAVVIAAGQYLLGVAVVFALCVLPFAIGGALEPMWEVLYTFTARYVEQAPGVPYTALWTRFIFGGGLLVATAVMWTAGIAAHVARRRIVDVHRGLLVSVVTLAALASVWLQKRFFSYHFMVAGPWLAACLVYGLRAVLWHPLWLRPLAAAALVASAVWLQPGWCSNPRMSYAKHITRARAYIDGELKRWDYLGAFVGMNYLDHYRVHERIGLEARRRGEPGDRLCARGFAAAIYQVSGMRCPSRHVIQMWPAGLPRWEREFWATVRAERPRFIVTFADRPTEVQKLRRLGYRPTRMPSIYLLMEYRGRRRRDTRGGSAVP